MQCAQLVYFDCVFYIRVTR